MADICHDFMESEEDAIEFIQTNSYILPRGLTTAILINETSFITFMKRRQTLRFHDAVVVNPLYQADILRAYNITPDLQTIDQIYEAQQRSLSSRIHTAHLVSLDLFMHLGEQRQFIKLNMIAQLAALIRTWFPNDFVIDRADAQLHLLMTLSKQVSSAFFEIFSQEYLTVKMIPEYIRNAVAVVNAHETMWMTQNATVYTAKIVDANIFDSATVANLFEVDERPTGRIFRPETGYQVELHGIVTNRVQATITDRCALPMTLSLSNIQSTKLFSKSAVQALLGISSTSTTTVKQQIANMSDTMKMALKRAGDWGQVEHCAQYGKTFITADRLAALYAYYRRVKFVLIRKQTSDGRIALATRFIFLLCRPRN